MRRFLITIFMGIAYLSSAQTADEFNEKSKAAFKKENYKEALKFAEKAINVNDSVSRYYFSKALALEELGARKEAIATYNDAIRRFPDKPGFYNNRGNILLRVKEVDLAIEDFNTAMNIADKDSLKKMAITNRAAAKMWKRDFESAYDDLILAYEFDSTDIAVVSNLGAICDEVGRGDETLKYLHKVLELDPTFYQGYVNIGFKYQEMGQHEKAIENFNKVLEYDANDPLALSNRSYNLMKIGDLKGAMKDIEKSIKIYPSNSYAYKNRALIYLAQKKQDKACEDLQIAIDKGFTMTYGEEVLNLQKEHCKP